MRHRAQLEAVGQHPPDDAGKVERAIGAWNGKPAAVDEAHETLTSTAPGNASSRRPRGTTLSDTDGAFTSQLDTAEATPLLVTFTIPLPIALEIAGVADEGVVGIQLIRLAAEAADGLKAINELRLGLRERALELGVGHAV